MHFNLNQSLLSGIAEEVSEFNPGPASQNEPRITSMITNLKGLINGNSSQQFTTLTCRSIRVGSYKILTKERVFFTEKAIYLKVIEYHFFTESSQYNQSCEQSSGHSVQFRCLIQPTVSSLDLPNNHFCLLEQGHLYKNLCAFIFQVGHC